MSRVLTRSLQVIYLRFLPLLGILISPLELHLRPKPIYRIDIIIVSRTLTGSRIKLFTDFYKLEKLLLLSPKTKNYNGNIESRKHYMDGDWLTLGLAFSTSNI